MPEVYKVNPSFEIIRFGGEKITVSAHEVFFNSKMFSATEEEEFEFQHNLGQFLNAAYAQGWVYITTIDTYPVFGSTIERALREKDAS